MNTNKLKPNHPGIILLEEFLKPMKISQYKLAKNIGVTQTRISKIIKTERSISPDTALRLALYFNTTAEFWVNLQSHYDLKLTREKLGDRLENEIIPYEDAA